MNYSKIICPDIANGLGCRCSIFVSGCRHHCKNCFNSVTWDFNYGKEFSISTMNKILNNLSSEYIQGLTILGGEPLEPRNQSTVFNLIKRVKSYYPEKDIWVYTGCTWEELLNSSYEYHTDFTIDILSLVDILVDGRFVDELKDISLKFRGSSNQRIIKSAESIKLGKIILSDLN